MEGSALISISEYLFVEWIQIGSFEFMYMKLGFFLCSWYYFTAERWYKSIFSLAILTMNHVFWEHILTQHATIRNDILPFMSSSMLATYTQNMLKYLDSCSAILYNRCRLSNFCFSHYNCHFVCSQTFTSVLNAKAL